MEAEFWNGKRGPGVEDTIHPDNYENIIEIIEQAFKEHAHRPAFTALGETLTFEQVDQLSANFAGYLQNETNLKPGDRIAIQMPSILQYLIVLYGSLRAGLVIVNTNPLYTAREMKHQFNDSGAKALVYVDMFGSLVEEVAPETSLEYLIQTSMGDMLPLVKRTVINGLVKYVRKAIPKFNLPTAIPFKQTLKLGKKYNFTPVSPASNDIALLQYTGGTTGVAKGAMILHSNLVAQVRQIKAAEKALNRKGEVISTPGEDIAICPLPLYHIYAFTVHCIAAFKMGNHSVLVADPRNTALFISVLKKWKFNALTGINTLFVSLMEHPEFKKVDFSHLKSTFSGGTALNRDTAERWQKMTGCHITEGYGLTETSPTACANAQDGQGRLGTIGTPIPGTAIKVIDDNGNELPFNEAGEICIKGPQVMGGYWQRPESTKESIVDGWFKTGDIGIIEEDGFVSIVDRKKDMIIVSGFNVYPNEIEEVMVSHPKVELCACIGVADAKSGEVPKLFVVKSDDSLTVDELKAHCKKNLTGYKQPKHFEFRDELPMTPVGKILRKELRDPQPEPLKETA